MLGNLFVALKRLRSKDPLERLELLRTVGRWILPKYRFKWPQMSWWNDPQFNDYLDRFGEREGMNTDRRWMLYQLLRLVTAVPGDTAECGVYEGAGSFVICRANEASVRWQRTHFAFDSFEGLSEPSVKDGPHWNKGDLPFSLEKVKENLAQFKSVSLVKGWIPERFVEVKNRSFAFVHIDVDLYKPTRDSIEFFYPRTNSGGIILCDDYGFTSCPGATQAVNEFLEDKPERMLALSCGGGFLIKGSETLPNPSLS